MAVWSVYKATWLSKLLSRLIRIGKLLTVYGTCKYFGHKNSSIFKNLSERKENNKTLYLVNLCEILNNRILLLKFYIEALVSEKYINFVQLGGIWSFVMAFFAG